MRPFDAFLPYNLNYANKNLETSIAAVSTFWVLQNAFQRLAGMLTVHSGRNVLVKFGYGLLSFSACSLISYVVASQVSTTNKLTDLVQPYSWEKQYNSRNSKRELLLKFYVGLGMFVILEQRLFLTSLPSSLLSVGVFANVRAGSLPASSFVASEVQRNSMQKFGRIFGCHHCGNRQFFSVGLNFIADHQPPSKIAEQMNNRLLAKMLRFEDTKQRLYPQCMSCFRSQGSAVRGLTHSLVYHYGLKAYHLAPALAIMISQREDVKKWTRSTLNGHLDTMSALSTQVKKWLKEKARYP